MEALKLADEETSEFVDTVFASDNLEEPTFGDLGTTSTNEEEEEDPEEDIDSFLEALEGESVGQMMDYLTSEIETEMSESSVESRDSRLDVLYKEVGDVTQNVLDKYIDTMVIKVLFKVAYKCSKNEAKNIRIKKLREKSRSTSDIEKSSSSSSSSSDEDDVSGDIRRKLKNVQKKYLLGAHSKFWEIISELKEKEKVSHNDSIEN